MSVATLRSLQPGQWAVVKKVKAPGEMGRRIREMGIMPGVAVSILGRAPLNDPVEVKLKGFNLSLRNNEADFIFVEPLPAESS